MKPTTVFRKDTVQTKALEKAGKRAAKTARRASNALGLSVTYIEKGVIYVEKNGEIIGKKVLEAKEEVPFEVKKGVVLHAK